MTALCGFVVSGCHTEPLSEGWQVIFRACLRVSFGDSCICAKVSFVDGLHRTSRSATSHRHHYQTGLIRRAHNLVLACALLTASVSVIAVNASGPMPADLAQKHHTRDLDGMSLVVHEWTGPQSQFVSRTLNPTEQDHELTGTPELGEKELKSISKDLVRSDAVNVGDDVSYDGPHGNFRTRTFELSNNRYCVALRSFDGRNQSNRDQYEYFLGDGSPMGVERVDGVFCRLGGALSAREIQTLVDGID